MPVGLDLGQKSRGPVIWITGVFAADCDVRHFRASPRNRAALTSRKVDSHRHPKVCNFEQTRVRGFSYLLSWDSRMEIVSASGSAT